MAERSTRRLQLLRRQAATRAAALPCPSSLLRLRFTAGLPHEAVKAEIERSLSRPTSRPDGLHRQQDRPTRLLPQHAVPRQPASHQRAQHRAQQRRAQHERHAARRTPARRLPRCNYPYDEPARPCATTPLHQAAYHGRYAMAATLVQLGAPLTLRSNPCGRGSTGHAASSSRAAAVTSGSRGCSSRRWQGHAAPPPRDPLVAAVGTTVGTWTEHKNIDMCMQGDVEIVHDWRSASRSRSSSASSRRTTGRRSPSAPLATPRSRTLTSR